HRGDHRRGIRLQPGCRLPVVRAQAGLPAPPRRRRTAVKMTPEQREILGSLHGSVRIAAGAGTGKTDTLRLAIVELIKRGARPGEILCLTFTVEATKEMRRRVYAEFADQTDLDPDELTVQTYHAFAASLLRQHALLVGLEGNPAL